jgi:hypothetical protein
MGSENGVESRCGERRRWRAKEGGCGGSEEESRVERASGRVWGARTVGMGSEQAGVESENGGWRERERWVESENGWV